MTEDSFVRIQEKLLTSVIQNNWSESFKVYRKNILSWLCFNYNYSLKLLKILHTEKWFYCWLLYFKNSLSNCSSRIIHLYEKSFYWFNWYSIYFLKSFFDLTQGKCKWQWKLQKTTILCQSLYGVYLI